MLFARGPTHLDSHQHVHREEPLRSVLLEAGRRLGIPVRDLAPGLVYRGDFYGQTAKGEPLPDAIAVDALLGLLSSLPPGITELGCHPASDPEASRAMQPSGWRSYACCAILASKPRFTPRESSFDPSQAS
jgi:hypothetical protein